jgi:hypothetical protein
VDRRGTPDAAWLWSTYRRRTPRLEPAPFSVPEGERLPEGDYGDDWLIGSDA